MIELFFIVPLAIVFWVIALCVLSAFILGLSAIITEYFKTSKPHDKELVAAYEIIAELRRSIAVRE